MQSWLWLPLAFGSAFFAALVAIFGKIGVSNVDSNVATTVRAGIMFVMLVIVTGVSGTLPQALNIRDRALFYIILAGVAGALSWICYFAALKAGRATQVAVVDRLSVVLVLTFAAAFLGEKLSVKSVLGVALMVAGAVLVTLA